MLHVFAFHSRTARCPTITAIEGAERGKEANETFRRPQHSLRLHEIAVGDENHATHVGDLLTLLHGHIFHHHPPADEVPSGIW